MIEAGGGSAGTISGEPDVSHLRTRRTRRRGRIASGEELPRLADPSDRSHARDSFSIACYIYSLIATDFELAGYKNGRTRLESKAQFRPYAH